MDILQKILALLMETHPRVYSVVDIVPRRGGCLVKFGDYQLGVSDNGEYLSTRETFSHVGGVSIHKETNILEATLFLRCALTEFDTRVFITGTQPNLPSEVKHAVLGMNEYIYRQPYTWSYSKLMKAFIRRLHDNRAAITTLLPQPIAEEISAEFILE